jgi:rsbT co-antagonist protein RsbR
MMEEANRQSLMRMIVEERESLIQEWMKQQSRVDVRRRELIGEAELRTSCQRFLDTLVTALGEDSGSDIHDNAWREMRVLLEETTRRRARLGFKPGETIFFVFSLKAPIFGRMTEALVDSPTELATTIWQVGMLLDSLGVYTAELHLEEREAIIERQRDELLELSTPVLEVWDRIVALPLIGTLDSQRAEAMTDELLECIATRDVRKAIIDVTGVSRIDAATADHLLKAISAAKLMGVEVIMSGLRPSVATTMVDHQVELPDVVSRPKLSLALAYGIRSLES